MLKDEYNLLKKTISIFLLSTGSLIFLTLFIRTYFFDYNVDDIALKNAHTRVLEKKENFEHYVEDHIKELNIVKNNRIFKRYILNENNYGSEINEMVYDIVESDLDIMQFRYIDKNGFEKIRIDRDTSGKIKVIPHEELQDKSQAKYFLRSKEQTTKIYLISPFEYNVENEQKTDNLTFRIYTPIFDNENEYNGLLIINIYAEDFLKKFTRSELFDITVFDDYGQIIYMTGKDYVPLSENIKNHFPKKIVKKILSNKYLEYEDFIYNKLEIDNLENGLNFIIKVKDEYIKTQEDLTFDQNLSFSMINFLVLLFIFYFGFKSFIKSYKIIQNYQKKLFEESLQRVDDYILYTKTDLKGKITYVSKGFCKLTGYSKEEIIGQNHSLFRHEDTKQHVFKSLWHTIKNKKTWSRVIKNKTKNGDTFYIQQYISPEYDDVGNHIGYVSLKKDITNQKELKQQKRYIETILNSSPAIIITTDGKELKSINNRFFEIFPYENLEDFKSKHKCICELFIEKEPFYIMPEKDGLNWIKQLAIIPLDSTLGINKVCMIDKDGKERIFKVISTGKILHNNNNNIEVVTFTEITQLIQNTKLLERQTKHAAMGEMLSMIAHQWSQPLTVLNSIFGKLKVQYELNMLDEKKFNDSYKKSVETIAYLADTVNDFKDYFKDDIKLVSTTLHTEFDKLLFLMDYKLKHNKITFIKEYSNETITDLTIIISSSKLKQILLNLINNAIDAIEEKNPENKFIKLYINDLEDFIEISVEDSAGGVPLDIMDKIFEPYFSTKSLNGTGIGLYMTKMLVENHLKGTITVENTENGALFRFTILKSLEY